MEKQKEEIVSELLALRAGLSVISQQADDVRETMDQIECKQEDMREANDALREMNDTISKARREYENCQRVYDEETAKYEQTLKEETRKKMKSHDIVLGMVWATGFFIFVLTTLSIVSFATGMFSATTTILFVLADLVLIGCDILSFVLNRRKFRNQIKAELDASIANLVESMRVGADMIETATKKRDEFIASKKKAESKANGEIVELRAYTKYIVAQSKAVCSALESTFSKQLNPADWQNIDLIIFYLQTGRADTLKEGLQLADRQRQTDEIVSTIKQASDRICTEIRNGIGALGRTMVTCFNSISAQIGAVSAQLADQHAETMHALDAVHKTSSELLSSEQLSNALQEKANATNERLMADLEYMRSRMGLNY